MEPQRREFFHDVHRFCVAVKIDNAPPECKRIVSFSALFKIAQILRTVVMASYENV